MADANASELLKWWDTLKAKRSTFDRRRQDIVEMIWPDSPDFTKKQLTQGEDRTVRQYDPVATLALEKFTAVMESLQTPRGRRWQKYTSTDDSLNKIQRVREFWDQLQVAVFRARRDHRARFYTNLFDVWKSEGAFGDGCLFVDGRPEGGLRYRHLHAAHIWIATNHDGQVDTIFRLQRLSARAAIQAYGEKAPPKVHEDAKKNPFAERDYLHVVMPRADVDYDRNDFRGMPWCSYEIAVDDKMTITEGGYRTWPMPFGRFSKNPDEDYGRGPASMVLSSVKTVNEMKRTHLEAGEVIARPPLLLPEDGLVGSRDAGGDVDMRSGGMIYGGVDEKGNQILRPFVSGGRLDVTREMMIDEHETIQDAFLVNLFKILTERPQTTAAEIYESVKEKGQLISPTVGRQEDELLGPMTEREMQLLMDQGAIPEMPPELVEAMGEYQIIYDNPATQMQRADEVLGVRKMLETAFALIERFPAQASRIEAMISVPEVIKLEHEVGGAPAKVLRGDDEVEDIMRADAEAAVQQNAMEQMPAMAKGVRDLAAAAKDAPQLAGAA